MGIRVGINGFGRIGRLAFRAMMGHHQEFDVVAVNDLAPASALAHLLKYDSAHGRFGRRISLRDDKTILVDDEGFQVLGEKDPSKLPWKELKVDVVIESTGIFTKRSSEKGGYGDHLKAGAKKVVLSAPASDEPDYTVVLGVNDGGLKSSHLCISNASCTTNCLAPMVKVLHESFGIEQGMMNTIHAYTNDQNVADLIHKDLRRARAAAVNIIPTSTGAAKAVGKVIPELNGKLNGLSLRVPVLTGSITDFTATLHKSVSVEDVNQAMKTAANGALKGILEYSEEPLVSSDIVDNPHSCIFDALSTMVMPGPSGKVVKVLGWYDNEWGYSCRTADIVAKIAKL